MIESKEDPYNNTREGKQGWYSHVVFVWIHCMDVRIHCTDILIECK